MHDAQLLRYSRHILLDEFGIEAQEKLLSSHALIVGAGGLGCPAALYLAASGVGRLSIADGDTVDATNLQRQILYRGATVGKRKPEAARSALHEVNPEVQVVALCERAEGGVLESLVAAADASAAPQDADFHVVWSRSLTPYALRTNSILMPPRSMRS